MADEDNNSERKSVTLSEGIRIVSSLPAISLWRRYLPYPSSAGFSEGEYIPQPEITITANHEWVRPKLYAFSEFAGEALWILRVLAGGVLVLTALSGSRPRLHQVLLVGGGLILFGMAILRFRVVARAEPTTAKGTSITADVTVSSENGDEERESEELQD